MFLQLFSILKNIQTSHLSKVLGNVKKNHYIINQNHIFSKHYCEVISGYILHQNIRNCLYFVCLFAHYVYMSGFYLYIISHDFLFLGFIFI